LTRLVRIEVANRFYLGAVESDVSARKPYDIIDEPVGREYWALIDGALQYCDRAVLRMSGDALGDSGTEVVRALEQFAVGEGQGFAPGLIHFTLNIESAAILKSASSHLYGWLEPELPSDLCLFRRDGSPWLMTVASERLGYAELTTFERLRLGRDAPQLPTALIHRASRDAILAVFERRYEIALEPLVRDVAAHATTFLDEGRDGLVEALGDWLHSEDLTRVSVAISVIIELSLDEFIGEIETMRNDAYAGRIKVPAVFDHNSVLRDRWLVGFKTHLDTALDLLRTA
jgi:hypothetical protein